MKSMTKAFSVLAVVAVSGSLTACNTTSGYNGYNANSPAVQGAVAGAALGALAKSGGDRGDIGKGAAIGAAVGGVGGYVLGNTSSYPYR